MSINAVSPLPRYIEPNPVTINPRLETNQGENSCWSTAMKVAAVIAVAITAMGSFLFFGPLVGLVVTLIAGTAGLLVFNACCGDSHNHPHRHGAPQVVPWYQRIFSFIPTPQPVPARRHEPHVPVGQGHITPAPVHGRAWYDDWFTYLPSGIREMNRGGHVPVGGGLGPGGHAPVGRGHAGNVPAGPGGNVPVGRGHGNVPAGPGGHVPVGRGHTPDPHGHGRGGPTQVPPPSGAGGHVPVGRRS